MTKSKFNIHKCSWPGCGAKTDSEEFWMDAGWMSFLGDPCDGWIEGMPESGFLCPHHKDAVNAFEDHDIDQFMLLASI
jgi:hypothetical protein